MQQINFKWVWETIVSDNKYAFRTVRNILSYELEQFVGYIFSSLFIQYKVLKGQLFPTAFQKDKSNPELYANFGKFNFFSEATLQSIAKYFGSKYSVYKTNAYLYDYWCLIIVFPITYHMKKWSYKCGNVN